jgi:beta-fructofuranosidase
VALRIVDKWVWDFWFARDGADYHIFYLQAPRSLKKEILRHWHVSVGHAVSGDLRSWEVLPDAFGPAPADSNAWDNYTTWTGSIIAHDGRWYQFYTGSNRAEQGLIQRVGVAISDDLLTWTKHPGNPVLTADPRWYEELDQTMWHDQAWRDPFLFQHDGRFHAYITARGLQGEPSGRGVVAHAVSDDLLNWECRPPVSEPGEFGQLEVPQLVEIDGRHFLLFCTGYNEFSKARRARLDVPDVIGTHYLVGDGPLGPFRMIEDEFLQADHAGSLYAGKVVQDPQGNWVLISTRAWTGDGGFVGEIGDPQPLRVTADGRLRVGA